MSILDICLLRNLCKDDFISDFYKICIIFKINLNLNLKFCREPDLNLNLSLERRTYQQ